MLAELEQSHEEHHVLPAGAKPGTAKTGRKPADLDQLPLFAPASPYPAVERLRTVDPDQLTPIQLLTLLAEHARSEPDSRA